MIKNSKFDVIVYNHVQEMDAEFSSVEAFNKEQAINRVLCMFAVMSQWVVINVKESE